MKIDAKEALLACEVIRFKAYLFWRVKHSRIKTESTIVTYWKWLSMLYAQTASRYMDEGILFDMNNVCDRFTVPLSRCSYYTVDPNIFDISIRP